MEKPAPTESSQSEEKKFPTTFANFTFNSSLPIRVTSEAQKIIHSLKEANDPGNKISICFKGGEVIYSDPNTRPEQKVIGKYSLSPVDVGKDLINTGISSGCLLIRVQDGDKNQLEFIIVKPLRIGLPVILRSSKANDQGGLTHRLKATQAQ